MRKGMLTAIESGYIEREIANTSFDYQQAVERKEQVVVGLNEYRPQTAQPLEVFDFDTAEEDRQLDRLKEARRSRSSVEVDKALDDIKRGAETDENLFPAVLAAAKVSATEGEVMGVLREVYGEHTDPGVF